MDQTTIVGLLIGALAIIVPLAITIITPIVKLNKTIQKLNYSIDRLSESDARNKQLLERIECTLSAHSKYLLVDKKRLDNLGKRLKKLDGQEGFTDAEDRE